MPISLLYLDKKFLNYFNSDSSRSLGLLQYSVDRFAPTKTFYTLVGSVIKMEDDRYYLKSQQSQRFSEKYIAFTKYGIELSSICQIGNAPGYKEAVLEYKNGSIRKR